MLVVCAVSRWQRRSSFDVNARGVLNALTAAIACGEPHDYCWGSGLHSSKSASNNHAGAGHERFITTGPHWTLFGAQEQLALNYGINEENVPHPGAGLYGITKGLGLEIARVYSSHFRAHSPPPLFILLAPPLDSVSPAVRSCCPMACWQRSM